MNRILIIEDDRDICLSLRYALEKEGDFSVSAAHDGESGVRSVRSGGKSGIRRWISSKIPSRATGVEE